jgi:hypothetical protein
VATKAWVFNTFTNAWTNYNISATTGIVSEEVDRLVLGDGNSNKLRRERKTFTYRDQADDTLYTEIISQNDFVLELNDTTNIKIGDVLVQPIYLTPLKYNSLLSKLDTDPGIDSSSFFSTYGVTDRSDIPSNLVSVATALTSNSGTTSNYIANLQTNPKLIQEEFNRIIEVLNEDAGVTFTDYEISTNELKRETRILAVDSVDNQITIENNFDLFLTDCEIKRSIETEVEFVPQHAGDPSILKHWSEAQLMFTLFNVRSVNLGFKTELSRFFEDIELDGTGVGAWGLFQWGNHPWGISDIPEDFRTFVPQQKQRCRFINVRFKHSNAYESYAMAGIALKFNTNSFRVNR